MAIDSMNEMRLRSGAKKVEQIKATGATIVASPVRANTVPVTGEFE